MTKNELDILLQPTRDEFNVNKLKNGDKASELKECKQNLLCGEETIRRQTPGLLALGNPNSQEPEATTKTRKVYQDIIKSQEKRIADAKVQLPALEQFFK